MNDLNLKYQEKTFLSICARNNLTIESNTLELIRLYIDLLLKKNKKVNLISRKDEENVWISQILSSLSLLFQKKLYDHTTLLDLGTGGGLPGIIYAILYPNIRFTLLDSSEKKIEAVDEFVQSLNLVNCDPVKSRAEELGKSERYIGKFDYISARAVAPLPKLAKWSYPLIKIPGSDNNSDYIPRSSLIAFKGGEISGEIERLKKLKIIKYYDIIDLRFNGDDVLKNPDRKVVLVRY